MNDTARSNTPTLTPTASGTGGAAGNGRDPEPFLISGFSNLSMGNGSGNQTSPRRQRSMFGSTWEDSQPYQPTGPIGSKRTVSIGPESTTSDRIPLRQPRGASSNSAIGFRRQNGRGSDELRTASSAIAE